MPIYEYQNKETGEVIERMRPVSECKEPIIEDGVVYERMLSPTPTDFRFNDFTGYQGFDKKRGN